MNTAFANTTVAPREGEAYEGFIVRAHRSLKNEIPLAAERNRVVWDAWASKCGPTKAEKLAQYQFSDPSKYVRKENVCVFTEHATQNSEGEDVNYTARELAEIVRNNNKRITERQAFSALCNNHTSLIDHSEKGDPEVLGAIGPYRLGMVGDEDQVFAIFVDEYHYQEKAKDIERLPRRSVELITVHATGEKYIDPIAALGGRAPRLPLPTQFSVQHYRVSDDGYSVDRYEMGGGGSCGGSAGGAVMSPGQSNTFTPSPRVKKKKNSTTEQYEDGADDMATGAYGTEGGDELVRKVVEAISQMPEMEWCRKQMEADQADTDAAAAMGGEEDADQFGMDEGGGVLGQFTEKTDFGGADASGGMDAPDLGSDGAGLDDAEQFGMGNDDDSFDLDSLAGDEGPADIPQEEEDEEQYMAQYKAASNGTSTERYQALLTAHGREVQRRKKIEQYQQQMLGDLKKAHSALRQMQIEKINTQRAAEIEHVCQQYSMFDASEEKSRLLGPKVSNDQYKAEIERMKQLGQRTQASRIPAGQIINRQELGGSGVSIEQNSALMNKMVEIQNAAGSRGEFFDYATLQQKAQEALAKPASNGVVA